MFLMKFLIYLLVVFPSIMFSQTEHIVRPSTTNSLSISPNNYHFIYINSNVSQKNKLFIHLPGTGGVPYNSRLILRHAANLGFHSIGLTYPNAEAINSICSTSIDTTCHSRARFEIFDGIDRHDEVSVDSNNCIEKRTIKLLQYLHTNYPTENWNQYFNGNEILWNKIIISGHSQGGGHAAIIGKIKKVERVMMFASMDWMPLINRNADWISWNSLTPVEKYYAFIHEKDELINFNTVLTTWNNLGINVDTILVDNTIFPYKKTQTLYTRAIPNNDPLKFHGCVVTDSYTPINLDTVVFSSVWTYMMSYDNQALSIPKKNLSNLKFYPNPVLSIINIDCDDCSTFNYRIFSKLGEEVLTGVSENSQIDVSKLSQGIYIMAIENKHLSGFIKFIKQ